MVLQPALVVEIEPAERGEAAVAIGGEYVAGDLSLDPGVVPGPHAHDRGVRALLPCTITWWNNKHALI